MARPLKQSTSVDVPIGPFLNSTDGITPESLLTLTQPDIRLKKNAAAWAQKAAAQTLTHEENGFYELTLDATDTDTLGLLRVAVFESGACPVWEDFIVVPANVYDSMFSTDKLEVDVVQISGSNVSTTAAQLGVNVVQVSGDATAADNLEAAADGSGYNLGGGSVVAASVTGAVGSVAAGGITAASVATNAIDADALATDAVTEIVAAVFARAFSAAYGSYTFDELVKLMAAALVGKASGLATTTASYRNLADTADVLVATVDADGNRTAVTRTP